jgi:uncharacterized membrane protein YidH (DUF202 family)
MPRARQPAPRPERSHDRGLQHERTAMAWERTAISTMVAGALLARYAATDAHAVFATLGIIQVAFGGALLMWAGRHYEDLHGPLRAGQNPSHPFATRVVGLATTVGIGLAMTLSVVVVLGGS